MIFPLFGNIIAYAAQSESPAVPPTFEKNFYYLSELPYIADQSHAREGGILPNQSPSGGNIQLNLNGQTVEFEAGIGAHADSCIVYDIQNYSDVQSRFVTYVGVDARKGSNGNGVIFTISVSDDGTTWEPIAQTSALKGSDNAILADVNVTGKKYLKLVADPNGHNRYDHSVYADARLMKPNYDPSVENNVPFHTLEEYDRLLSVNSIDTNLQKNVQMIYQRELVNHVGYGTLRKLYNDERYQEGINFLITNSKALSYFIEGSPLSKEAGTSPRKAMLAFCDIYNNHKAELLDPREDDFYLRLAISIACAHNYPVNARFWMEPNKELDASKRFETYVELSKPNGIMDDAGKGDGSNKWSGAEFRALSVPMMRWVVDARMNDDEFFWLADYALKTRETDKNFLDAYSYIEYKNTFKYNDPKYYAPEKRSEWNEKYNFEPFFSDYGDDIKRLWIVFEEGAVCGGLAKTYANLAEVFGRPSIVVGQPGHAATVTWEYSKSMGKYIWVLQNDVYGWVESNSEYNDFMLGWGLSPYATQRRVVYTFLAFDAIEDYQNYVKATQCVLLANSYKQASQKEALYLKALEHQRINLDAWTGLTTLKLADQTLTSKDYLDFAKQIMDTLTYYPKPMEDLLTALKPKITDDRDIAEFDLLRIETLKKAANATTANSRQPDVCKTYANFLLNEKTTYLATFSFDGDKAGKIVLSDQYEHSNVRVRYSLDGGTNWIQTSDHEIQLTEDQLASLTAENDIKVGFVGVDLVHTIDLTNAKTPQDNGVIKNDYENIVVGNTQNLEFSIDGGNTWCSYIPGLDTNIRFDGDQQVQMRYKNFAQSLHSAASQYDFTLNNDTPNKTYLLLKNVNLVSYSSQQNDGAEAARNLIDGNINTRWHSAYNRVDDKEYVVGFDSPRFISMLEYFPYSPNGRWRNIEVYTTMDAEVNDQTTWKQVAKVFLENNDAMKTILLNCDEPARFLKIKGLDSWGNSSGEENKYFSGRMLNFYEDLTKYEVPPATISYSTQEKTNQDVTATITLPTGCTMVEGELTHTFTENGSHTFHYQDAFGNLYEATASVDWIRKAVLTGSVTYSETESTHNSVVATVGGFEYDDVYVSNNNQSPVYTFTQNGEFVFELADSYGNTGTVTATVNNIDVEAPKVHVEYSTSEWTSDDITASLVADDETVQFTIVNNEGSSDYVFTQNGSFTFEVEDPLGNRFNIIASVDCIDKSKEQVQAHYSTLDATHEPIQVELSTNPDAHEIINNNGANIYTFHKNGTFVFKIRLRDSGKTVDFPVTVSNISDPEPEVTSSPEPKATPAPQPVVPPVPQPEETLAPKPETPAPEPETPSDPEPQVPHDVDPEYPVDLAPQAPVAPQPVVQPASVPQIRPLTNSSAKPASTLAPQDTESSVNESAETSDPMPSATPEPEKEPDSSSASASQEALESQASAPSSGSLMGLIILIVVLLTGLFIFVWLKLTKKKQ